MNKIGMGRRASLLVVGIVTSLSAAPAVSAEAPYGMDTRPALTGLTFPDLPPPTNGIKVEMVFPQIRFYGGLLYLTAAPGDDSTLYAVTKSGVIYSFPNIPDPTPSQVTTFLDISSKTLTDGEQGLLGLAFDPGFASNKTFYVYYTPNSGAHRTRLAKFTIGANKQLTLLSEKAIFQLPQDDGSVYHKAGCLQLGPDGKLWLSTGDGSNAADKPNYYAQKSWTAYGRILRMNLDGSTPSDNPFVGNSNYHPLIWAMGLRNPWRFSIDRVTGEVWAGDVGQEDREEIDLVRKGGNYGWSYYEGDLSYNNDWDHIPYSNFDSALLIYPHDGTGLVKGASVIGGYVYRGSEMPGLVGKYVFGDFIGGGIYVLTRNGNQVASVQQIGSLSAPTSFGQDNAGNIYVTGYGGDVYRVQPAQTGGSSASFPTKLSQTGLFTDLSHLTPTQGLIEYEINAPFWSDGAIKRRWVGVPGSAKIGLTTQDAWTWPAMSVIVKHFDMQMADGTTKRLETRVLIKQKPGWRGYTYRWNSAGTDADLIDGAQTVTLNVMDPSSPTGARTQTYEFPGRGACLSCHNSTRGEVLGLRTSQINRSHKFGSGVTDNQLRTWNHIGLFDRDISPDLRFYYALPAITDASKGQAARARAYFDVNCAQCHLPGGPAPVNIDFRVTTGLAWTNTLDIPPSGGNLGVADARRIAPGAKERSIIWQRMNTTSGARMPAIGSHAIDSNAVALIGQWIDAGAPESPDQTALRPMFNGNAWGKRSGLGEDYLSWTFPRAQSCTITMYNSANKNGKSLGTFGGTGTLSRSGPAIKDDYWFGCTNPYGTDWWTVTLK
ncbi:MAG TPA: PQQ-dependent sugar dehydrogenase [Nevskiaceae bacterium]|nr:PQQ-dependent sugar dehydrogenase [Nevskiaceae bacterium]